MSNFTSLSRQIVSNFKRTGKLTKAKRDWILSILRSTTTKREARNFLVKYQNQFDNDRPTHGARFSSAENSSRGSEFIQRFLSGKSLTGKKLLKSTSMPLRVALIKMKTPEVPTEKSDQLAETLRRLMTLGISPIIIFDHGTCSDKSYKLNSARITEQAQKLSQIISKGTEGGSEVIESTILRSTFIERDKAISIDSPEQVIIPLYQNVIPIVLPLIYHSENGMQEYFSPNKALYHMCSELLKYTGLLSIEKVVMIDKLGGIPSIERNQTSHVFINLSQEFSEIVSELFIGYLRPNERDVHLSNLVSMNDILTLPSSDDITGIITTSDVMMINDDQINPLVYNILTDRPIISSSLPSQQKRTPQLSTSIIKKGFEVRVIDEYSYQGPFTFSNLVRDNYIDQTKLFDLINDSFGRELKVDEYLKRIDSTLATVIIAGDYEGAAIITWETLESGERIPYLDKFAIAKKNQGLPSLADVIFKLISQSHQTELVWRSRANNPVNKWYFERSRGSVKVPDSPWKLFFTGDVFHNRMGTKIDGSQQDLIDITKKLKLYSELINSVEPSFK